jgi:hypothetical protein
MRALLKRFRDWKAARTLYRALEQADMAQAFTSPQQMVREAHETYKMGDFTATIVGNRAELDNRMLIARVNGQQTRAQRAANITDLAFNGLIKVEDE